MSGNVHEDTQFRVLRLLQETPNVTQREIAETLGISLGGVNYCLRALANRGMVKFLNFRKSNNKLGYTYLLTPEGIARKTTLTARFLKRKLLEYESLKAEIEDLKAELAKKKDSKQPPQDGI